MSGYSKYTTYLVIVLLILGLIGSWWYFLTRKPEVIEKEKIEYKTDTVTVEKPVPVVKYKEKTVYKEVTVEKVVFRYSLVYVMLPREVKEYRDSTYYAKVSGIDPDLDYIETYNTTKTITKEKYIYKKPILVFGIGAGVGYDPVHKTVSPTISGQVTIPIYSIYR